MSRDPPKPPTAGAQVGGAARRAPAPPVPERAVSARKSTVVDDAAATQLVPMFDLGSIDDEESTEYGDLAPPLPPAPAVASPVVARSPSKQPNRPLPAAPSTHAMPPTGLKTKPLTPRAAARAQVRPTDPDVPAVGNPLDDDVFAPATSVMPPHMRGKRSLHDESMVTQPRVMMPGEVPSFRSLNDESAEPSRGTASSPSAAPGTAPRATVAQRPTQRVKAHVQAHAQAKALAAGAGAPSNTPVAVFVPGAAEDYGSMERSAISFRAARNADMGDGEIHVSAPAGALVYINGMERGIGAVVVGELDRTAKHSVRVIQQGHVPWMSVVTFAAQKSVRVKPELKAKR